MPHAFLRAIIYGVLPIVMSFIGALAWLLIKYTCKRRNRDFTIKDKIWVTAFVFVFLFYPMITKVNFSLFNCF